MALFITTGGWQIRPDQITAIESTDTNARVLLTGGQTVTTDHGVLELRQMIEDAFEQDEARVKANFASRADLVIKTMTQVADYIRFTGGASLGATTTPPPTTKTPRKKKEPVVSDETGKPDAAEAPSEEPSAGKPDAAEAPSEEPSATSDDSVSGTSSP